MRINFLSRLFSRPTANSNTMTSVSQKVSEIKSRIKLEQRAEDLLQSRLTDWRGLMRNVQNGDILEISTVKKFTGKFRIATDEFEEIHKIKDGKNSFYLIREKDGTKHFATTSSGKTKDFTFDDEPSPKWEKLALAMDDAINQMREKFVIHELMKSGKNSIVIQGNY